MPGLSSGINIALQALLAHSQAIEIIEHNVANANTVGYRRQSAVLSATVSSPAYMGDYGSNVGQRGTGVTVDSIKRFSLDFFDGRYRSAQAESKNWGMQKSTLVQMEATLAETGDDGLIAKMDEFWSGWQVLSSDPSNTSLRATLLDEAGELTDAFNSRAVQLNQLRVDQDALIGSRVDEINELAASIADLNGEISRVLSVGEQPNDLLDRRDLQLDRLAEIAGATSSVQANGEAVVSIGGHILITGHDALRLQPVTVSASSAPVQVTWEDGQPLNAPSGELSGLLNVRDTIITRHQTTLNQTASALATSVNGLHRTGYGLDNSTGLDFFTLTAGSEAMSLRVNTNLTANNLAVASRQDEPGNSDIAASMAELKTTATVPPGSETLNQFYNSAVTRLGLDVQKATNNTSYFGSVAGSLSDQRESVGGVSLDEEAANLAKYQKAYEAAARVLSVYNEMLDTIINGMGVS